MAIAWQIDSGTVQLAGEDLTVTLVVADKAIPAVKHEVIAQANRSQPGLRATLKALLKAQLTALETRLTRQATAQAALAVLITELQVEVG